MKSLLRFLIVILFAPCLATPTYAQATAQQPPAFKMGVDVLSDTGGVNLTAYMKNTISDLRKHWVSLVTDTANQPLTKKAETSISFTIAADGSISTIGLEDSSLVHDVALDKAAWKAVTSTSYLPPPTGELKLRVHFVIN